MDDQDEGIQNSLMAVSPAESLMTKIPSENLIVTVSVTQVDQILKNSVQNVPKRPSFHFWKLLSQLNFLVRTKGSPDQQIKATVKMISY
jgi:hypothetical protein